MSLHFAHSNVQEETLVQHCAWRSENRVVRASGTSEKHRHLPGSTTCGGRFGYDIESYLSCPTPLGQGEDTHRIGELEHFDSMLARCFFLYYKSWFQTVLSAVSSTVCPHTDAKECVGYWH